MRRATLISALGLGAVGLVAVLTGCSGAGDKAPKFSPVQGQHPAGWVESHYKDYVKNPDSCRTCHGSTKDPAAAGGISGVSCFKCHIGPDHPAGFAAGSAHGRNGAQLPPGTFAGFASCAKCHGSDYKGSGTAVSCMACHTTAPHPPKAWYSTSASLPNHDKTDAANAPECFKCHAAGANSTMKPTVTPAPGTAPGCFNNTMCHGREL